MGRRRVEVVVALLDVLAVVPLTVGEAEQPFLQNRIALVPQRDREAQDLLVVADAADPVFPPPVGAAPRRVVAHRLPRVAAGAVVFAHGAPLTFAEIGTPRLPAIAGRFIQTVLLLHALPRVGTARDVLLRCRGRLLVSRNLAWPHTSNRHGTPSLVAALA